MADNLNEKELQALFNRHLPMKQMPPEFEARLRQQVLAEVAKTLQATQYTNNDVEEAGFASVAAENVHQLQPYVRQKNTRSAATEHASVGIGAALAAWFAERLRLAPSLAMAGATLAALWLLIWWGPQLMRLNPLLTSQTGTGSITRITPVSVAGAIATPTATEAAVPGVENNSVENNGAENSGVENNGIEDTPTRGSVATSTDEPTAITEQNIDEGTTGEYTLTSEPTAEDATSPVAGDATREAQSVPDASQGTTDPTDATSTHILVVTPSATDRPVSSTSSGRATPTATRWVDNPLAGVITNTPGGRTIVNGAVTATALSVRKSATPLQTATRTAVPSGGTGLRGTQQASTATATADGTFTRTPTRVSATSTDVPLNITIPEKDESDAQPTLAPPFTLTPTLTPVPTRTPTRTPTLELRVTIKPKPTQTATPVPTKTATSVNTPTKMPTRTPTVVVIPTASNTPTVAATNTFTPMPTRTFTPVPPTNTPTSTPTRTFTPVPPTNTPTPTLTRTFTPVPPTNTPTPTFTFTPVPPTNTPTPTPTSTFTPVPPTNTPTPTFTFTPVPPTNTSTPVPTDTQVPTNTPVPTDTPMPTATSVPTNSPPIASSTTYSMNEDESGMISLRPLVKDVDGGQLSITIGQQPQHGGVQRVEGDIAIYIPTADFNGQDSFTYLVTDGFVTTEGRVIIQVNAVNDAPKFTNPSTERESRSAEVGLEFTYQLEVLDADGEDSLTISLEPVTAPPWLTIEATGDRQAELKGTANLDQVGTYEFVVIVRDSAGAEDRLDFKVEVVASSVMGASDDVAAAGSPITTTEESVTNSLPLTSTTDATGEEASD